MVPHQPNHSLVQEHSRLDRATVDAFVGLADTLRPCVSKEAQIMLATLTQTKESCALSHISSTKEGCVYTSFVPHQPARRDLYIVKHVVATQEFSVARLYFNQFRHRPDGDGADCFVVLDAQFYNEDVLSVLLCEEGEHADTKVPLLVQLTLKQVHGCFQPLPQAMPHTAVLVEMALQPFDAARCLEKMDFRRLEKMRAASFAVSGARNVVCVLFHSRRRVRTFEMDVEEEEDDEDGDEDEEDKEANFTTDKDMAEFPDDDKENSF
ncbi:hypothetical protein HPB48_009514 [Haemaphysalis longicornis]|uniref:Anaphase-promoting complex subunit 4 C-terminal half WD40 domain-containing protein n=1 Tax=Haemaphysalis longicornis TaxID=44386 RepID=A0A9J6GD87_HAELO|nr:hypothetical protein HPB48_009514 [Haemaphysalis longicornis]